MPKNTFKDKIFVNSQKTIASVNWRCDWARFKGVSYAEILKRPIVNIANEVKVDEKIVTSKDVNNTKKHCVKKL